MQPSRARNSPVDSCHLLLARNDRSGHGGGLYRKWCWAPLPGGRLKPPARARVVLRLRLAAGGALALAGRRPVGLRPRALAALARAVAAVGGWAGRRPGGGHQSDAEGARGQYSRREPADTHHSSYVQLLLSERAAPRRPSHDDGRRSSGERSMTRLAGICRKDRAVTAASTPQGRCDLDAPNPSDNGFPAPNWVPDSRGGARGNEEQRLPRKTTSARQATRTAHDTVR